MPSLTCFSVRFTPNWMMIFLAVLFISSFMRLGFWQLHRADEKEKMLLAQAALVKLEPLELAANPNLPKQYQNIQVKGHYLPDVFLLDNQHRQHLFGYDVLTPLLLADGKVLMVDRGWIQGDPMRSIFPEVLTPKGVVSLQGSAYFPSVNKWLLGPGLEKKREKLTILEAIDVKLLGNILQKEVRPFIMRLSTDESSGFVREWAIVSMPPVRHVGYAVQWFAMALAILILFIALNVKKIK